MNSSLHRNREQPKKKIKKPHKAVIRGRCSDTATAVTNPPTFWLLGCGTTPILVQMVLQTNLSWTLSCRQNRASGKCRRQLLELEFCIPPEGRTEQQIRLINVLGGELCSPVPQQMVEGLKVCAHRSADLWTGSKCCPVQELPSICSKIPVVEWDFPPSPMVKSQRLQTHWHWALPQHCSWHAEKSLF